MTREDIDRIASEYFDDKESEHEMDEVFDPVLLRDYYPEFEPYAGACRFSPCYHGTEPGCAVLQAAKEGKINAQRLERYHTLLAECRQTWRERYD